MALTKRRNILIVTLASTALVLAGCGMGGSETPTTAPATTAKPTAEETQTEAGLSGEITFQTWSLKGDKFSPYFEKLVADFEAANPGTTINWIDQPGDGYADKVMQQATAGQLPDVVNLPPDFAFPLAQAGKLADLRAADPAAIDLFTPGGIAAYEFDGLDGSFGYPWYLGTDLNWWNTQAFTDYGLDPEKLPTTLDELYEQALIMAEASGGSMHLMSSAPQLGELAAAGVTLFKDGEFVFNTEDGVAVLQKYVDLYQAGAMPLEVLQDTYLGNSQLFLQGKVAWTTGSASFPRDLDEKAPTIAAVTVASGRIGVPPLFVQGVSVSAESKNPDLALAFAQFAMNDDNQIEFVRLAQGFLPGTAYANANPETFTSAITEPKMAEAAKVLAAQMPNARVLEPVQFSSAMKTYVQQQITAAMRGDLSAQEALDKAVQYCNDNLAS